MTSTTHLVTADKLLELGGDARFELIEGVLVELSPSSIKPGVVAARLVAAIVAHTDLHGLGHVSTAEGGFILGRNPDTVIAPDVGFFRSGRFPGELPDRGFYPMPPDLAVEVISPSDSRALITRKQELYDRASVPMVWWVDPESQTVTVHRPGHEPQVLDSSGTLDGGEVLPGFSLPVERIFAVRKS